MAKYNLTRLAVKAVYPTNDVIVDDKECPSIHVYIPKFKNSDVFSLGSSDTHPAFIVNGKEIDGFWFSKYQNVENGGRAYSLPCEDPRASVNFDTSRGFCEAKGTGWHITTNAEWAAVALWCKKNGFLPYGNNNNGKDARETQYLAIPTYKDSSNGKTCRVATGTGPVTWSHNKQPDGIWDLNGNVSEWVGGLRFVYGEVQILENNNAADKNNSQAANSACWKAIDATTGNLITPNGNGTTENSVKCDYISGKWTYTKDGLTSKEDSARYCPFASVVCDGTIGDKAKELLIALCLCPDGSEASTYENDYFYLNNGVAERFGVRGGYWGNESYAGVFYLAANYPRSYADTFLGFRSAFIEGLETDN